MKRKTVHEFWEEWSKKMTNRHQEAYSEGEVTAFAMAWENYCYQYDAQASKEDYGGDW